MYTHFFADRGRRDRRLMDYRDLDQPEDVDF